MGHIFRGPAVMVLVLLLAGSQCLASSPAFDIQMESGVPYFSPNLAIILEGSPIRWDNPTGTPHAITHDGCRSGAICAFESGSIPPSGVYEVPGLPPGTYLYHCSLHPIMRGVIRVIAANSTDIQKAE